MIIFHQREFVPGWPLVPLLFQLLQQHAVDATNTDEGRLDMRLLFRCPDAISTQITTSLRRRSTQPEGNPDSAKYHNTRTQSTNR